MAVAQPAAPAVERPAGPSAPRAIAKLPEHVVNRIAAGEGRSSIIQRPSNALKELLENSLDAGATTIRVTVKEGGLKQLQIQDNGSGIRKDDLPILCERFTTSKIKAFEDLSALGTYGFRGEALASISHVAHLSVTTKTKDDACAWKASYADGKLIPSNKSSEAVPVPTAGNDGTVLLVEDLFYNTPQRLKSIRSASEEYARIVAVVNAYSIHNSGIAMSCKKMGAAATATADINTTTIASTLDNIGAHYGEGVRRELVEVKVEDELLNVKVRAWCSNANYQGKKGTFLFFINNRYVDCTPLKRALEAFYSRLLAKGTHPFVYLSLEIDPRMIDVNVHPTKKEVGFEDEDEIVELVCEKLGEVIQEQGGESRSYKLQTIAPSSTYTPKPSRSNQPPSSTVADPTPSTSASTSKPSTSKSSSSKAKAAPHKLVRTDAQSQTLDALFPSLAPSAGSKTRNKKGKGKAVPKDVRRYIDDEAGVGRDDYESDDPDAEDKFLGSDGSQAEEDRPARKKKKHTHQSDHADPEFARQLAAEQDRVARQARVRIAMSECALTSVRGLRKEVVEGRHEGLDQIMKNHIFVGVADLESSWSMIQHQTKLYLVNHSRFAEELFYQLGLRQFGRFSRVKLKPPPSLRKVVKMAVARAAAEQEEEGKAQGKGRDVEGIVEQIYTSIFDARAMLDEYFSFSISDKGDIESLPLVLPGYSPDLSKLPLFLFRLGAHVNWEEELPCFSSFLRELAFFYSPSPTPSLLSTPFPPLTPEQAEQTKDEQKRKLQHVLFPALKQYLVSPERLLKKDVVLATSLESLYRVFERC
ncbi:hypothetical protein JCM8547_002800 [Rhodosporidiobolus lusitaniae]